LSGLELLEDLEKNPAARKYDDKGYNLAAYKQWLESFLVDYHWKRPAIHVAGTKGKGSVCAMLEAILLEAGLNTGLYTSPHMNHFGERYRINGSEMYADEFEKKIDALLRPHYEDKNSFRPTVFETLTGLAFQEFEKSKLEAEIYEVGLGGRLDCTNLITPDVSVITSIGMDHTAMLGDTIEKITMEKGGIIKDSVPLVVPYNENDEQKESIEVLAYLAKKNNAPYYKPYPIRVNEKTDDGQRIVLERNSEELDCTLNLIGNYQAQNWAQAVRAADLFMAKRGTELKAETLLEAAKKIQWRGRLQYLRSLPAVLVDSAHCPLSAKALGKSLAEMKDIAPPPYVLLWGMQKDKNHLEFLKSLCDAAGKDAISRIVCYSLPGPRGASSTELYEAARDAVMKCIGLETVEEAFYNALQLARPGSVLACGTVYTAGKIIELHENLVAQKTK